MSSNLLPAQIGINVYFGSEMIFQNNTMETLIINLYDFSCSLFYKANVIFFGGNILLKDNNNYLLNYGLKYLIVSEIVKLFLKSNKYSANAISK